MLRFHRGWGRFLTPGGAQLWSLTTNERFGVRGDRSVLATTFEHLSRGVPDTARLEAAVGRPVAPMVAALRLRGAVIDDDEQRALPSPPEVYRHQTEFFDLWETPELGGAELHQRLRDATVVIVGVGAFGTWIALECARVGIGRIVLVDPDRVEHSNLARQVLYTVADVGERKVDVAARALRAADPDIDVRTSNLEVRAAEDLAPLAEGTQLVFNAFGFRSFTLSDLITGGALLAGTPCLQSGGASIGPLTLPGRSACPRCLVEGDAELGEVVGHAVANRWLPPRSPFAPIIATMSSLAVWEAARFLSGCAPPLTLDAVWMVDLFRFRLERRDGARRPDCALCGSGAR